jgi:hypothetical protein
MSGRRALISKDDLARMACAVAAYGVTFKGRVDAAGNFDFTVTPGATGGPSGNDDLDDRLDSFGAT